MWVKKLDANCGPVTHKTWMRRGLLALFLCSALLAIPSLGWAAVPISQEFLSTEPVAVGSIVSLHKDTSDQVDPASTSNIDNIIGVVINAGSAPISLSGTQANEVEVATTGVVPVLVSNINGDIRIGDQITASPINGVGMKATGNVKVIGAAQDNLTTSSNTEQQSYTDKNGQKHTILLGEVPVLVSVSYFYKQPDKTIVPQAVQNIANALAGKPVNTLPVIISAAIFIVTLVVVLTLIYTMIHGSIISVGRNPMSQAAIYRNLVQLSGLVILILGVAFTAIYLILTRF